MMITSRCGSPCLDCEDRHRACWGDCDRYKTWRDSVDNQIAAANKAARRTEMLREVKLRGMRRAGNMIWKD